MGKSTVSNIVSEVCEAIWNGLKLVFGKMTSNPDEWPAVSKDYEVLWNFPHCLGAIDGKHIVIQARRKTHSHTGTTENT